MKLSDSIATGRALLIPERQGGDGEGTGCVLQLALAAVGLDASNWELAAEEWPWLTDKLVADKEGEVHQFYDALINVFDGEYGDYNLDQIIDWVRSIEPPEPEFVPERGADSLPHKSETAPQEVGFASDRRDVAQPVAAIASGKMGAFTYLESLNQLPQPSWRCAEEETEGRYGR